jgi:Ca-activated chloride channel family protein
VLLFSAVAGFAADPPAATQGLSIELEPLGDTAEGVVSRLAFKFTAPTDAGALLVLQGSILRDGKVLRNFRHELPITHYEPVRSIVTFTEGTIDVEARLLVPLEEGAPVIVAKTSKRFTIAKTNREYVASVEDGAEAMFAEGVVPESTGAVRIRAPRRDVAPNLFIVEVDVQEPVARVEFFVEGKKVLARNTPPFRAELDLGKLPKRVEVRAVGYDSRGRYVDADAFLVNERETPLEVKITRTETPDGVSHFKLSIQNPKSNSLKSIVLFAGDKQLHQWTRPPYALDVPTSRLANVDFVRASVTDDTGYEASDLLFLSGERFIEEIEVNLVELPVAVHDRNGTPIANLAQNNFSIFENGKPVKISNFNFATNLPVSVGVMLDHSGSMKERIKPAREAAIEFFKTILKGQDRAFIAGFSIDATKVAPFASDLASLTSQVGSLPDADGGTSLYDAIITGLYRFRTVQGRKALVVITDGEDTTSRLAYDDMLTYARAARVPLYFIGIDLGWAEAGGTQKMRALAAETGGVAYFIKDVRQLHETYEQLEKELRSQYFLTYHTESSKKDQAYRTIEVKVDRPDARVRTIRGFIP